MMRKIAGLSEIAAAFDGMIIDQFGVLHDGRKLYPGAAEVMAKLHAAGIKVVIVTNSGKRAEHNASRIVAMGIDRAHFMACVSSGEIAYQSLTARKAFIIGRRGEDYGFDGLEVVANPQAAEVMLILGSNAPETSLADYRRLFTGISLPAICCNPDRWMITPQGLQPAPGAIAALYEDMGGQVTWIGKPHAGIYREALTRMNGARRVLCIGDSAEHDVAGGRGLGLATLLVLQGVSAGINEAELQPRPDYLLQDFVWMASHKR